MSSYAIDSPEPAAKVGTMHAAKMSAQAIKCFDVRADFTVLERLFFILSCTPRVVLRSVLLSLRYLKFFVSRISSSTGPFSVGFM